MQSPREQQHLAVKKLMFDGQFLSALTCAQKALADFGPHILLSLDTASCYYMLGDFQKSQKITLEALETFKTQNSKLSQVSILRSSLGLGKLLEEFGQIYLARRLYELALKKDEIAPYTKLIQAQLLRIQCLYPVTTVSAVLYRNCESQLTQDAHVDIDLQLALLHADIYFVGFEGAIARIEKILKLDILKDFEKRLLIFDFLFECLRLQKHIAFPAELLEKVSYLDCDVFEKSVWDFYLNETDEVPYEVVSLDRCIQQSPLCALRYLLLLSKSKKNIELAQMAYKKMAFTLTSMDPKSRTLLNSTWQVERQDAQRIEMKLMSDQLLLLGQAQGVFQDSQVSLKLFAILSQSTKIAVDVVIQKLYGVELTESSFDRLRVLISRINKKLYPLVGVSQLIKIRGMAVTIDQRIDIKLAG